MDIEDHKLTMATELGADHVVNALTTNPVEAIQALGGADVAVALAASPGAFDQAYRSLRRGGRLVCVALPADNATLSLPIFNTVINGKTVIGSIVGTRNDLADVFALHAAGRTTVIAVDRKIDEVNQSIERRPRRHRPGPCRLPVLITGQRQGTGHARPALPTVSRAGGRGNNRAIGRTVTAAAWPGGSRDRDPSAGWPW